MHDLGLLNRKEDYEVLYFINKGAIVFNIKMIESGQKVGKMIRNYLPENIHSQDKILIWINENWDKH